jgi:hypothetical protein
VKAWERAPRKATAPRLRGQKVWKRPGLRSQDNKENHEASQAELLKAGIGSRKRARMQGAKENISDPKWLTKSGVSDTTNDAPIVAEDKVQLSVASIEMDNLQRMSRKRTNTDHILTPRKHLQKRSSSEANYVLSPLKLRLSPEKQEKRRKSVRKSLRRTSIIREETHAASPRRASLRKSAVFNISSIDALPELPKSLDGGIDVPSSEPEKKNVEGPSVSVTKIDLQEKAASPLRAAVEPDTQITIEKDTENPLATTESTSTDFIAEVGEDITGNLAGLEHDEQPILTSTPLKSISESDVFVFTGSEEKVLGAESAATPAEGVASPFLKSLLNPATITTPTRPTMARRSATEKPATRQTTRATRRSLRPLDFPFKAKTFRATRSKSPKKTFVPVEAKSPAFSPMHDNDAAESDDEAIHQQLFDCPSPRKAAREAAVLSGVQMNEPIDRSHTNFDHIKITMPMDNFTFPSSDSLIMSSEDEAKGVEETDGGNNSFDVAYEVEPAQEFDQGSPLLMAASPSVPTILPTTDDASITFDIVLSTEVDPTADESILSNDLFTENVTDDSIPLNDEFDETENTLESFELMEPITVSLSASNSPTKDEEDDTDELLGDMTAYITIDVAADDTQELKLATYDHDDTDVLLEFLNRVKADKAAKAVQAPPKKKRSLPHSPLRLSLGDEGVDELASLEIISKDPFDISLPTESPKKRRKTSRTPEEAEDTAESQSFRRSGRTRLPVTKSLLPAPSFISIARPNGDATINLKQNHDKELAALTRNNTRKNKGAALHPQALLIKQASGKDSPASRHKALKDVFEEKAHRSVGKKKKSVVWAEELTQFQILDKRDPLAATIEKAVEVVKSDKKVELPKVLETLKELAVPAEEKKEERKETKKSSIPRVSMKSKIALGMAVNGTPARKMRKRL